MKRITVVSIALLASISLGCRGEARKSSSTEGTAGTAGRTEANDVPKKDKDFVHDVGIMNLAEIEFSRLAVDRGLSDSAAKFARTVIDDHTKALDNLRSVAAPHNISVPTELDDKHRKQHDSLAGKQGMQFETEYVDLMVDGHNDLVDALEARIDKKNVAEYKAEVRDRLAGKKVQERAQVIAIIPEPSDNPVTMSLNQWAADTYPIAVTHLEAATLLKEALKKRSTH